MIPMHEDAVKFNEVACCAMRNLVCRNAVEKYQEKIGDDLIQIFLGIFENTEKILFIPSPIQQDFFLGVIGEEIVSPEKKEHPDLLCGHSRDTHCAELRKVYEKLCGEIH